MVRNSSSRSSKVGRSRRALILTCSLTALCLAQTGVSAQQSEPDPAPPPNVAAEADVDTNRILVIGNRSIVNTLQDLEPEQVYGEDDVASYAVSTVGELLDEIRQENGDDDPSFLVNGQRVSDFGDISDLPVEAIARIEQLPRGASQRLGGSAGQRAYNVVLLSSMASATFTGSHESATEGTWYNTKAETLLTYLKGQDRLNITLRAADSTPLFEADRDLVPRDERYPFAGAGNIIPASGIDVDSAFSSMIGQTVSVVALPAGVTSPTLAMLVAGANRINPSERPFYRTLRGANRPAEVAVAGNKTLTEWLSLSINGRLGWSRSENSSGMPTARFLIPASNPYSPFSGPVYLALSDPSRRLRNVSEGTIRNLTATLNASWGGWTASLAGKFDDRKYDYVAYSSDTLGSLSTVDGATNPFDGSLAQRIPVSGRFSKSRTGARSSAFDAQGPLLAAWAGTVYGRLGASATWVDLDASDSSGVRSFDRHEYMGTLGITVPLTSAENGFLGSVGDSELGFDIGRVDMGRYGLLKRRSLAFSWQPAKTLRLTATEVVDQDPIFPELLASAEVETPNVPYFDPLRGETVDVTTVYGGAAGLSPEKRRTRTLSLNASPLPEYRGRVSVDYAVADLTNQVGALPQPSSEVVSAFPDRFVRDAGGTLVLVDNRPVNFARQHNRSLRFGAGFTIPLVQPEIIPANRATGSARRRVPGVNLQVNGSHTYLLESKTVIRSGLPEIDLLEGAAIGLGGAGSRNSTDVNVSLSKGSTGMRAALRRRGVSYLTTGSLAAPDLLTFGALTTLDVRSYTDLGEMFPTVSSLKGTRLTFNIDNLLNKRQKVIDGAGSTPQAYQPVYRDPIGRTVQVELRKVF